MVCTKFYKSEQSLKTFLRHRGLKFGGTFSVWEPPEKGTLPNKMDLVKTGIVGTVKKEKGVYRLDFEHKIFTNALFCSPLVYHHEDYFISPIFFS